MVGSSLPMDACNIAAVEVDSNLAGSWQPGGSRGVFGTGAVLVAGTWAKGLAKLC